MTGSCPPCDLVTLVVMELQGVKLSLGVGISLEHWLCLRQSCGLERYVSGRAGWIGFTSAGICGGLVRQVLRWQGVSPMSMVVLKNLGIKLSLGGVNGPGVGALPWTELMASNSYSYFVNCITSPVPHSQFASLSDPLCLSL